jgi:hypothetical protein
MRGHRTLSAAHEEVDTGEFVVTHTVALWSFVVEIVATVFSLVTKALSLM